jgi:hypothetical protein
MSDIGPDKTEDPRIAPKRAIGELWQRSVIAGWKIVAAFADLRRDLVKVVEKPLGCRHNRVTGRKFKIAGLARG